VVVFAFSSLLGPWCFRRGVWWTWSCCGVVLLVVLCRYEGDWFCVFGFCVSVFFFFGTPPLQVESFVPKRFFPPLLTFVRSLPPFTQPFLPFFFKTGSSSNSVFPPRRNCYQELAIFLSVLTETDTCPMINPTFFFFLWQIFHPPSGGIRILSEAVLQPNRSPLKNLEGSTPTPVVILELEPIFCSFRQSLPTLGQSVFFPPPEGENFFFSPGVPSLIT